MHAPSCPWVASFASDTPFFPTDVVARLMERVRREQAELGCAASNGRNHPVFGLWPVAKVLTVEGIREIGAWTARHHVAVVEFPSEPYDPFFNVNTPEDLQEAGKLLALANGWLQ